jgi:hypothetical protein
MAALEAQRAAVTPIQQEAMVQTKVVATEVREELARTAVAEEALAPREVAEPAQLLVVAEVEAP